MSNIKIRVKFENGTEHKTFKIQLGIACTVGHLLFKLRKYLLIKPETAVFTFFQYKNFLGQTCEKIYNGNKFLSEIAQELNVEILDVKLLLENTFGDLDSRFINASIVELDIGVWILTINYTFYSLYNYKTVDVFKSMDDAIKKLSLERCSNKLIIKDKNNVEVNI